MNVASQTRLGSLIEALFSVGIGLLISITANALVFPHYGFHPTLAENVTISLIYTAISIARQYVIRRWFNARLQRAAMNLEIFTLGLRSRDRQAD